MGRETNAESIRALEGRIEDGNGDTIKLKRARNSLLNITRVPPEILGDIFSWILVRPDPTPESGYNPPHFDGFHAGSHHFLLVCHRWFEVATRTPKLWTFCGNTLEDWKKWHLRHHRIALPLDLVLKYKSISTTCPSIDPIAEGALRDRATRDAIRQVHLLCYNGPLLSVITSLLTPEGEGVQNRSIESIDIRNPWGVGSSDISSFFARIRFPKLQSLLLHGALILASWDNFAQQATLLTTLSLRISSPSSPPPTNSQLFSILVSNPGLQVLSLTGSAIPGDDDNISASQVTLRHLRRLCLCGDPRRVVGILERLTFPRPLDILEVSTPNSTAESISQTLGPYARHYFQNDYGVRDRLKIVAQAFRSSFRVWVENEDGPDFPSPFSTKFEVSLAHWVPQAVRRDLCPTFVAFIPPERVCSLHTSLPAKNLEDLLIATPNIETLSFYLMVLSEGFLQPNQGGPDARTKFLPSLRSLHLDNVTPSDDNWGPLTTFLRRQTSDGRYISLSITGFVPHMCPEVVKEIEGLVGEFNLDAMETTCPLGRCEGEEENLEGQDGPVVAE